MAAYEDGSYMRVKAGPGTGKTFALMRRITRLLEEGVEPESILTVSFTRTAANDLVKQLERLGAPGADKVHAMTLHSLAFRILSAEGVLEDLGRHSRSLMEFEKNCMVYDLVTPEANVTATRDLLMAFETYWATLQHQVPGYSHNPLEQDFERRLLQWLTNHRGMLVDELIVLMIKHLQDNPLAAAHIGYKHILVDEYQDLNRADQMLIDLLAKSNNLTVIGDDDQSIYSFRHAQPEGIISFHTTHAPTLDIELLTCRRCPKKVVEFANHLILNNEGRFNPSAVLLPFASNPEGNVSIVQHESVVDEARNIADYIKWQISMNEVPAGQILVLAARKQIGLAIRSALVANHIPAQSFFNEDCLEQRAAQEGICVLNLLINEEDKIALRAWLSFDKDNKRVKQYAALDTTAKTLRVSIFECLEMAANGTITLPVACRDLLGRYQEVARKVGACQGRTLTQIIDICWPAGNADCFDVRRVALRIAADQDELPKFHRELLFAITQPIMPSEDDGIVRIMSLYKSKGLTSKCAIVVGCNAGILPRIRQSETQLEQAFSIEEQRRLFYVAITRTTDTLVISSAALMPMQEARRGGVEFNRTDGNIALLRMSPFIRQLGPNAHVQAAQEWREAIGF
ncbi:ATP-dependent helicase [Hymenobacter sp. BT664]|uniref:DNA 3'-5' helicase n=1 Tax=Hymenobacter montanus TaxID=2771359 RepID=A0A927BGI8_9BACT|nr:ATP-dependent helicase [Hymenobacter montanus]MBD2769649.1 ATP-dependent helicase [Hymenobacter montanus]